MLAAAGAFYLESDDDGASLHLTRADWQDTVAPDYTTPPSRQDSAALPAAWRAVTLPIKNDWFAWLTVNALFWLVLSVHVFLCQLHRQPLRWLTRALVAVSLLIGVLTLRVLAVLPTMPAVTPMIYPVAALMSLIACVAGGTCAWRHSGEGRLVVYGLFACTALGLTDCLDDLKLTIDSMEPVEADLLLLLATLRFRLEPRLEGSGVGLLWEVRELPALEWLNPSSALHILRIVQESIANILRHTRATEIRVGTTVVADGVEVRIADNGGGFDVAAALGHGGGRQGQLALRRRRHHLHALAAVAARIKKTPGPELKTGHGLMSSF